MSTAIAPSRSMFSTRVRAVCFVLAIVLAMGFGYCYRSHYRYKNVAVHEPGVMYRAAWVEPDVLTDLIKRHQIRTVVNLCSPGELGEHRWAVERDTVRHAGAQLLELPMSMVVNPRGQELQPHLSVLADPENYPILVHCKNGMARTSKFLAIYDMCFRGKTAAETLAEQPLFGTRTHDPDLQAFCDVFESRRVAITAELPTGSVHR